MQPLSSPVDERAVIWTYQNALAGDVAPDPEIVDALNTLFASHHDRVFRTCLRYLGNAERAREVSQEALLRAFHKLPGFRREAAFSTWLHGIARLECRNAIRKRREVLFEDGVFEVDDPAASTLTRMHHRERQALFLGASKDALSPLEQEAIYLRYVEQISQERITEILEISDSSGARGLLQRCRRKLRRALRAELERRGHGSSFFGEMP